MMTMRSIDLQSDAVLACLDIYKEYTVVEIEYTRDSVRIAWELGRQAQDYLDCEIYSIGEE